MAFTFDTDMTLTSGRILTAPIIKLPTASGSSTYGVGSSGSIARSNGSTIYWDNIVDLTSSVTIAENLTLTDGGIYQIGNIVCIQGVFKATADFAISATLISSLPKAANVDNTNVSYMVTRCISNAAGGDLSIYMHKAGTVLKLSSASYNTSGGLGSGKSIVILFSYVAE